MVSNNGVDTETRYKIHSNQIIKGHATITVRDEMLGEGVSRFFGWEGGARQGSVLQVVNLSVS